MSRDLHTVSFSGADLPAFEDRLILQKYTTAYAAGSGAGSAVNTPVVASIPPGAAVILASVGAGVTASVALTATGFTLTTAPTNNANTLAAGAACVIIIA